ncbi:hypothetical protein ACWD4F_17400 [Streptomyces aureus]
MELSFLRPLYEVAGSVVSVHLDTSREDQDADKCIEVTWQNLRRDLEGLGADAATLDVLEAAVGGSPEVVGPQGESLSAAHGRLLAVHTLAAPPKANRAVVEPVADAVDTVLDWDRQLPHVVVAIDRQGGDIDGTGVARSTVRAVARSAGAPLGLLLRDDEDPQEGRFVRRRGDCSVPRSARGGNPAG